jgi:hypothetical protein
VTPGEIVAVYDFGGGTFDIALLRHGPGGFELIGTPVGVDRLGGIDFDLAVLQHVNDSVGGALDGLDPRDEQTMPILAKLRRDSREAKESLSADNEAVISVIAPGANQRVRLTRAFFESMIRPRLDETFSALRRAVTAAGITENDIGRIVLVGGSSRIPLIRDEVRLRTARPIAEDVDPEYAVALGAARLAAPSLAAPTRRPPPSPPPSPQPPVPFVPAAAPSTTGGSRRGWLVAAAALALVALGVAALILVTRDDDGDGGSADTTAAASATVGETAAVDETTAGPEPSVTPTSAPETSAVVAPSSTELESAVTTTVTETSTTIGDVPTGAIDSAAVKASIDAAVASFTFDAGPDVALTACPFGPLADLAKGFAGIIAIEPAEGGAQTVSVGDEQLPALLNCDDGALEPVGAFLVAFTGAFDPEVGIDVADMIDGNEAPTLGTTQPHEGGEIVPYCEAFEGDSPEVCGAVWIDAAVGVAVGLAFLGVDGVTDDDAAEALKAVLPSMAASATVFKAEAQSMPTFDAVAVGNGVERLVVDSGIDESDGSSVSLEACPFGDVPVLAESFVDAFPIAGELVSAQSFITADDGTEFRDLVLCSATVNESDVGESVTMFVTAVRVLEDFEAELADIIGSDSNVTASEQFAGGELIEYCLRPQGDDRGCGAVWLDAEHTIALGLVINIPGTEVGIARDSMALLLDDLAVAIAAFA